MKDISGYQILIWSKDPDNLAAFYRDVLELSQKGSLDLPDDYGYSFQVGEQRMWIGKHSQVADVNQDTYRFILNFYVDDVHEWFKKVKDHPKVEVITSPFVTPPTRGKKDKRYACTFLDPDGNCLQFMTTK